MGDRPCAGGIVREARDHGPGPLAAVAAPGEADGMAFGVVGARLPVGSGARIPDVSEHGVDPLEGRHASRPAPGVGADRPVVAAGRRWRRGQALQNSLDPQPTVRIIKTLGCLR